MPNNNNKEGKEFNPKLRNTAKLVWQTKPRIEPEPKNLEFQTAEIVTPDVEKEQSKLRQFIEETSESKKITDRPNRLIWGDNLLVMQALLAEGYEGKIDLIYIDPPFNTGEDFNFTTQVITPKGEKFDKEWTMIERLAYTDTWERGTDSFLDMLYPRLILMRKLLSDNGSIYLQCDQNASHYIKVICDEIFGKQNFVNEIIWERKRAQAWSSDRFGVTNDSILLYSKSGNNIFNPIYSKDDPNTEKYIKERFIFDDGNGRKYMKSPLVNPLDRPNLRYEFHGVKPPKTGWLYSKERMEELYKNNELVMPKDKDARIYRKIFLDQYKGQMVQNIWTDIPIINPMAKERLDFQTQKPEALLKRIIETSSNEGNLIADFFCGSGTTLAVAEQLGRRWIGADYQKTAIHVTRNRLINLNDELKEGKRQDAVADDVSPFIIQNLGNYQRHLIYTQGFNIKKANSLIMKLYGARQREDIVDLGIKEDRKDTLVFVSYPDRHLTAKTVLEKAKEIEDLDSGAYKKLVVLAWDYEINYDQNLEKMKEIYKPKHEIESKLIPTDIYAYLKKVDASREDQINSLRDKIQFFEKPYLKISKPKIIEDLGNEARVRLEIERYNVLDIPIKDEEKKTKLLQVCKNNFAVLIDYYATDWNYDGETFKSQTQVMAGFGKNRQIVQKFVDNKLRKGQKYIFAMRLVDIFGNDAEARTEIDLR